MVIQLVSRIVKKVRKRARLEREEAIASDPLFAFEEQKIEKRKARAARERRDDELYELEDDGPLRAPIYRGEKRGDEVPPSGHRSRRGVHKPRYKDHRLGSSRSCIV